MTKYSGVTIILLQMILIAYPRMVISQYFQQAVDYDIDVVYNEDNHQLVGEVTIHYQNNSPHQLDTIYLHLWANAFKDNSTAYTDQTLKMQNTTYYFSPESDKGGYQSVQLNNGIGELEFSDDIDKAYIVLDQSLGAGESIEIKMAYMMIVPKKFSRLGRGNDHIAFTYWYPKVAVYDMEGWHWFSYLDLGEFYSDFGDYQVSVTIPSDYDLVSTGKVKDEKLIGDNIHYSIEAERVIDFAIIISNTFEKVKSSYKTFGGKTIDLQLFMHPSSVVWKDLAFYSLKSSLDYYESEVGEYPYPQLSTVIFDDEGGGMEYPMLITVSADNEKTLDYYINHEVGHQWFYGVIGFNERSYPFLDEGLTTFYEHQYTLPKLGQDYHTSNFADIFGWNQEMPILMQVYQWQKRRGFSESPSKDPRHTSMINYGVNAYERAAMCYKYLQSYLGKEVFKNGIQTFYSQWQFRHPRLPELLDLLESESGKDLSWFIPLISEDVTIDFSINRNSGDQYVVENKGDIALPFKIDDDNGWYDVLDPGEEMIISTDQNHPSVNLPFLGLDANPGNNHAAKKSFAFKPVFDLDHSRKSELYYSALATWNYADGFSVGPVFYNSTIPSKQWQFLAAPQFGVGSQNLIGNAWIAYNAYPDNSKWRKIQYKLSAKRYSYFNSETNDYRLQYSRITPAVTFHFYTSPNSQKYSRITFKSIFLNEEVANFTGPGEFIIDSENSLIHQIKYDYYDFNVLSRKEASLWAEQQSYDNPFGENQHYLKLTGFLKYSTKYKSNKGIHLRLFASGFLKNTQRQSSSFNSSLAKGSIALLHQGVNDYTYEEYFLNRQSGDSPFTNQVSYMGGGFKDALGPQYSIGLSNDFAASANFSIDLPMALPAAFPFRPFFDVGYYRTKGTLNDPLQGKTIWSGGLMLSYLDGGLEIYFPLVSSGAINDIYSQLDENIWQRISFSIDLHRLNPWDLVDDLSF